jgi:hypothetical protein
MWNYLLAILGLTLLTSLWMVFQLWLKKKDPEQEDRCIGCGSNCKRQDAPVSTDPKDGIS